MIRYFSICILLYFCLSEYTIAQKTKLDVVYDSSCFNNKSASVLFDSKTEAMNWLNLKLHELYVQGYAASYIDTNTIDSLHIKACIQCKSSYQLRIHKAYITNASPTLFSLQKLPIYKPFPLNQSSINYIHNTIITFFENNGYPFTSSKFDSIQFKNNHVFSNIEITTGPLIKIDSINIKGDFKLSPSCLFTCIGIKPGDVFNQKKINKIQSRLKSLDIATITSEPSVLIKESNAFINIYATKKQTGEFDGLIGILPNHYVSGKVVISGEMHLKLTNSFSHAEEINIDWQHKDAGTQQLQVKLIYPYILKTPISPDYQLNIYKKDSSYITSTNLFAIQYRFNGKNYFKSFIESSNTATIKKQSATTFTNPFYNTSTNMYGGELFIKQVNNTITPTKGFEILAVTSAGIKKIKADSILINNQFITPKKSSSQYRAAYSIKVYLPIYKRNILYLANSSNWISNDYLSVHDFTRIGGFKTLRGFDEESFRLATYTIGTIEYRYMLEKNTYFTAFIDHALFKQTPTITYKHTQATGLGIGTVFETKAGLFSIFYALGLQPNESVLFKNAKIHFGYVNRF